jgi:alkanesulfonate monooxygenase SsuD/methylene tetrahydromethanopterin reductase-like flavin-dependent oxidoreductase (luciferase family)
MSERGPRSCKIGLYLFPEEGWMHGGTARWEDVKTMAQTAEAIGFDSVWLPDRLLFVRGGREQGLWESFTMLAAIAAVTARVEIGHLVARSIYRHPALLAKMIETIDEISAGRFILGLGAGSGEGDNLAFGYPTTFRYSRFAEALHITLSLLRQGRIDFKGRFYEAHRCTLRPRGPRQGGPPVLMAAVGPKMMRLAAQHADMWSAPLIANTPRPYEKFREPLDAACREVGRDPSGLTRMAAVGIDSRTGSDTTSHPYGESLAGPPEVVADALGKFVDAGYRYVLLFPYPNSPAAVEACAPILEAFDQRRR